MINRIITAFLVWFLLTTGVLAQTGRYTDQNQYAVAGGSANAVTLTYPNFPATPPQGVPFRFKTGGSANSGATTVTIAGGSGTKNLYKISATGPIALTGGELPPNSIVEIAYDGTQYELQNSQAASAFAPPGAASKLVVSTTGNTTTTATANLVVLQNGSGNEISVTAVSCSINWATTGANALDTGSLAASSWYYIFVINNGTTTACLGSASSSAPTLPATYIYFARVGAVPSDSSSHLMRVLQMDKTAQYVVTAATNTAALPIVASGAAGSISTPTFVAVTVQGNSFPIPPTASEVHIGVVNTGSTNVLVVPNNSYGASTSSSNPPFCNSTGTAAGAAIFCSFGLESTQVFWANNAANALLNIVGWKDNL
jgi:hypothetical protein